MDESISQGEKPRRLSHRHQRFRLRLAVELKGANGESGSGLSTSKGRERMPATTRSSARQASTATTTMTAMSKGGETIGGRNPEIRVIASNYAEFLAFCAVSA